MDMTATKTVVVFAIIFGCFAILYPKIFHPMLLHVLGFSSEKQGTDDISAAFSQVNRVPPHLRKGPGPARVMPGGDEISRHMRPGPHPGLRAAAEMKKQTTTPGSGKGMMGVVLPMYAVGIVIYLVYTLTKVFGKKEEKKEDFLSNNPFSEIRYDSVQKQFQYNDESEDEAKELKKNKTRQRDLERLLLKADERNITDYRQLCDQILQQSSKVFESEGRRRPPSSSFTFLPPFRIYRHDRPNRAEIEMRQLKERLLETEAQMSRILKAMEVVSESVPSQDPQEGSTHEESPLRPADSSPDMDSYEIINGDSPAPRRDPNDNVEDIGTAENVAENQREKDSNPPEPLTEAKDQSEESTGGDTYGELQEGQEAGDLEVPTESAESSPEQKVAMKEAQDEVNNAENDTEEVIEEMIPEKEEVEEEPRPDLRKRKGKNPRKDN